MEGLLAIQKGEAKAGGMGEEEVYWLQVEGGGVLVSSLSDALVQPGSSAKSMRLSPSLSRVSEHWGEEEDTVTVTLRVTVPVDPVQVSV